MTLAEPLRRGRMVPGDESPLRLHDETELLERDAEIAPRPAMIRRAHHRLEERPRDGGAAELQEHHGEVHLRRGAPWVLEEQRLVKDERALEVAALEEREREEVARRRVVRKEAERLLQVLARLRGIAVAKKLAPPVEEARERLHPARRLSADAGDESCAAEKSRSNCEVTLCPSASDAPGPRARDFARIAASPAALRVRFSNKGRAASGIRTGAPCKGSLTRGSILL